jgi:hypothetical protein
MNIDSEVKHYFQWFVFIMCWVSAVLAVIFVLGWGMSQIPRQMGATDKAIMACTDNGGVPITGEDDDYIIMKDCKFK